MEYIYAAILLHKAGKKVDEKGVKSVLDAAGVKADDARVKSLIAALDGVNIDEAIAKSAITVAPAAAAAPASSESSAAAPSEEKEEKKEEDEASGMEGLGALFG